MQDVLTYAFRQGLLIYHCCAPSSSLQPCNETGHYQGSAHQLMTDPLAYLGSSTCHQHLRMHFIQQGDIDGALEVENAARTYVAQLSAAVGSGLKAPQPPQGQHLRTITKECAELILYAGCVFVGVSSMGVHWEGGVFVGYTSASQMHGCSPAAFLHQRQWYSWLVVGDCRQYRGTNACSTCCVADGWQGCIMCPRMWTWVRGACMHSRGEVQV